MKNRTKLCMIMTVAMMLGASFSLLATSPVQPLKATILMTNIPQVSITSPSASSSTATNWGRVLLSGTATDDVKVTNVTWSNAATGAWGWTYLVPQWGAASVTWQSRGTIMLAIGDNVITVTANDTTLNQGTDVITITYEKVLPICTIETPTTASAYFTNAATVSLGGSASDASGIAAVSWKNVATGSSGAATGTTGWSISDIALNSGMNLIYVNVTDNAGNKGIDSIWVTRSIDTLAVDITEPVADMSTNWHYVILKGTASDDIKVTSVAWSNALTGDSGTMYMNPQWGGPSVNWQTRGRIHLLPGDNVITVTAYDNAGNSNTDAITVTYTGL